MMKKKVPSASWLVLKVIVMVMALVGVFWARSALQNQTQPAPTERPSIPAKVEFGK